MNDATADSTKGPGIDEQLRIARGDDPRRTPLWNGPHRATTTLQTPIRPMADDGQMFEFLFPYPIHIFDSTEWPPLRLTCGGLEVHLLRPTSMGVTAKEQVAVGNESPDLYCSNVRVIVLKSSIGFPAAHGEVFEIVRYALQWLRVLSRQYWIGTGTAGVAATYRGTAFRTENEITEQINYAAYGRTVIVRAFPVRFWEPMGTLVQQSVPPPISESIFCDALSSFAAGDTIRCAVELGVSIEIELTNLFKDLATVRSTVWGGKNKRERRNWSFETRFREASKLVGTTDPKSFSIPGRVSNWVELIYDLYRLRNKAAHEGRAMLPDHAGTLRSLTPGELQGFIFAAEVFFRWSNENRSKAGLANPSNALDRSSQIIGIVGGT